MRVLDVEQDDENHYDQHARVNQKLKQGQVRVVDHLDKFLPENDYLQREQQRQDENVGSASHRAWDWATQLHLNHGRNKVTRLELSLPRYRELQVIIIVCCNE